MKRHICSSPVYDPENPLEKYLADRESPYSHKEVDEGKAEHLDKDRDARVCDDEQEDREKDELFHRWLWHHRWRARSAMRPSGCMLKTSDGMLKTNGAGGGDHDRDAYENAARDDLHRRGDDPVG